MLKKQTFKLITNRSNVFNTKQKRDTLTLLYNINACNSNTQKNHVKKLIQDYGYEVVKIMINSILNSSLHIFGFSISSTNGGHPGVHRPWSG